MILALFDYTPISAVACKFALNLYSEIQIYYIRARHFYPNDTRLLSDCERWFGHSIRPFPSDDKYYDSSCELGLIDIRSNIIESNIFDAEVLNLDFSMKGVSRALQESKKHPHIKPLFPLIEYKINENDALRMLIKADIYL